ncbi:reverse transcriptase N-terminal domain-containing protein (plasmid) [Cupriavidus basilensis]
MKALQRSLTRSWSAKASAVRRVTEKPRCADSRC